MEVEVQPLILHPRRDPEIKDSEHSSSIRRQCMSAGDDLEGLKQQQQQQQRKMESASRKPICSSFESCCLSKRSSTEGVDDGGGDHHHGEDDRKKQLVSRRLWLAAAFCLTLMVVEVVGGFLANSLAILADAAHLLSDVASFGVSIFAVWASGWKPTPRCSYGFHRLETLGALLSILILWIVTGCLVYEAVYRLAHELSPVDGRLMFGTAALGFLANLVMVFILGHGDDHHHHHHHHHGHSEDHTEQQEQLSIDTIAATKLEIEVTENTSRSAHRNLNLRGAYLHILGDMIQSVGVLLGGAVIWRYPSLRFVDVICTLVFSMLVLWTTLRLLRDVIEILMESSPREFETEAVRDAIERVHPDVVGVHELHIWSVTTGKVLLSCHVAVSFDADCDLVLREVIEYCNRELKISHVTVQIERDQVDQV